jgi:peptidoglycan/LPS O-acetylase OafA/YrhL
MSVGPAAERRVMSFAAVSGDLSTESAKIALPVGTGRIRALDGIRGLAILLVLWAHYTGIGLQYHVNSMLVGASQWGWVGVDLFFVLSGFLITGILVDSKGSNGFFKNFYARRFMRIFPAYYALLVIIFLSVPFLTNLGDLPDNRTIYGPHWIYWLYLYNFYGAFKSHSQGLLAHTWTLAIEEQFYLIWPAIVFLCDRKRLLWVCGIAAVAAMALRIILLASGVSVVAISFLTITRMDSLTIGAAIALLLRQPGGAARVNSLARKLIWLTPICVLLIYAGKKSSFVFFTLCDEASKYTLLALFFGALISLIVTSSPSSMLNRLFSISWMRFFGRYSYGIYLFHVPMLMLMSQKVPNPLTPIQQLLAYALFLICTVLLGLLSWNLVEKHFLKLKRFFPTHSPNKAISAHGVAASR